MDSGAKSAPALAQASEMCPARNARTGATQMVAFCFFRGFWRGLKIKVNKGDLFMYPFLGGGGSPFLPGPSNWELFPMSFPLK